jgi:hypothetical protein
VGGGLSEHERARHTSSIIPPVIGESAAAILEIAVPKGRQRWRVFRFRHTKLKNVEIHERLHKERD